MGQKILLAPNGREAKLLAGNVTMIEAELEKWKVSNVSIMGEILECKSKSCTLFKDTLIQCSDNILAKATSDVFWRAGLTLSQIEHNRK